MLKQINWEIERLKGAAIILAMMAHFDHIFKITESFYFDRAAVGVDLFFVISGVLIGGQCLRALPSGTEAGGLGERWRSAKNFLRSFYIRRFFRVAPLGILWAVIFYAILKPVDPLFKAEEILALALSVINLYATTHDPVRFGYFWSLSMEEQFYVVLPLLLILVPGWGRRWFLGLSLLVGYVVVRLWLILTDAAPYHAFFHTRYGGLIVGTMLALFLHLHEWRPLVEWPKSLLKIICLILFIVPVSFPDFTFFVTATLLRLDMSIWLYLFLVYIAILKRGFIATVRPLDWLLEKFGQRAYTYYVTNIPVFIFHHVWVRLWIDESLLVWSAVASTIIVAELSYRFIEVPAREWGYRLAGRFETEPKMHQTLGRKFFHTQTAGRFQTP